MLRFLLLIVVLAFGTGSGYSQPVERPGGTADVLYSFPASASDISVGRNGENTFSLKIPAFPSYLTPGLAAVYNSRGKDSIMGMGWALPIPRIGFNLSEGTSVVGQMPLDGVETVVGRDFIRKRWTSNVLGDLLCENDRSKSTALAGFVCHAQPHHPSRFIPVGTGSRPLSWMSKDPLEGVTQYYGENPATRIENSDGVVVNWLLTREVTRNGQEVRYFYEEKKGTDQRLLRAVLTGGNKIIRFNYVKRQSNILIDLSTTARRSMEWLLDEIELVSGCVPEQIVEADYSYLTSFDACLKSETIQRIKLSYQTPSTRYTGRYALTSWQRMSGDKGIVFGAVRFRYNGDGLSARGNGAVTASIVRTESPQIVIPDGYAFLNNYGRTAFQNYADWNRDGLADWISVKSDSAEPWPDPEKTDHRIHVKIRDRFGGFSDIPGRADGYQDPLSRFARWVHRPDDGSQAYVYVEPLDSDRGNRVAADPDEIGDLINAGSWNSANIGLRADPWIYAPLAEDGESESIFSSLSMTLECEKFGVATCDAIRETYRVVWDDSLGDFDEIAVKVSDLADFNGDGYLDRAVSGLLVIWDPDAPDSDALGNRDPLSAEPAIYVSLFDPDIDDFTPFQRYAVAPGSVGMSSFSPAFLSALSISVKKNANVNPVDLSDNMTVRSVAAVAGLGIQGVSLLNQLPVSNASSNTPANPSNSGSVDVYSTSNSLIGIGLTSASLIASHSSADPDVMAGLAHARLVHSGVTASVGAVESVRAATEATRTISTAAGWASFANAIVGAVSQTINTVWNVRSKERLKTAGFNSGAIASNTVTGTSIITIIAAVTGITAAALLLAAGGVSALSVVGLVAGIILSLASIVLAVWGLAVADGRFETRDGEVVYDFRPRRGIVYRNNTDPDHFAQTFTIIDWTDLDGDQRPDLVMGKYVRGAQGFAVSSGASGPELATEPWQHWRFPDDVAQISAPKSLDFIDIDTRYERRDVHRGDQADTEIALLDINGDGLADVVDTRNSIADGSEYVTYLNTGRGFGKRLSYSVDIASLPAGCSVQPKISRSRSLSWTESIDNRNGYSVGLSNVIQVLGPDLDNNGLPDLVVKDERAYSAVAAGGACVRNTTASMCDSVLPVDPEPEPSAPACDSAVNRWYANFDGFGNSNGDNEGDSHLTIAAHSVFSPTQKGTHYVAFNTGTGFSPFVRISQALPSFGGSFSAVSIVNPEDRVPEFAVGGTSNALIDPDADGRSQLVALDLADRTVSELDGQHPVSGKFSLGLKNPDALNAIFYPDGGQALFDYELIKDIGGTQGAPIWALSRAEFNDGISPLFAATQNWTHKEPYVNYSYAGARWQNREFLGFEAIGEERFDGDNFTQVIQTYHQSGPERGSVACLEVRNRNLDNQSMIAGDLPATPICTANEPQSDGLGVGIGLLEGSPPGPVQPSCYADARNALGLDLFPLQQRVTNHYETDSSISAVLPGETAETEIRRVANLKRSRTETHNGSQMSVWLELEVDYNDFPYLTPISSRATSNDGLTRRQTTGWRHENEHWLFLKTHEARLDSSGNTILETTQHHDQRPPFNLSSVRETSGSENRIKQYFDYDSAGNATRIVNGAQEKSYSFYQDFENGTGLLKSASLVDDEWNPKKTEESYAYNALGQVSGHVNKHGGRDNHRYDQLGLPLESELAGGVTRRFQYRDHGQLDFSRAAVPLANTQRTIRIDQIGGEDIYHITWWDGFMRPFRQGNLVEGHQNVDMDFNSDGRIDHTVDFRNDRQWFDAKNKDYVLRDFRFDAGGLKQCASLPYFNDNQPRAFSTTLRDGLGRSFLSRDYAGFAHVNDFSVNADARQSVVTRNDNSEYEAVTFDGLGRGTDFERPGNIIERVQYTDWDARSRVTKGMQQVEIIESNGWNQPVKTCVRGDQDGLPQDNICPAEWASTSVAYDTYGLPVRITNLNGDVTDVENSTCGKPGSIIYPGNHGNNALLRSGVSYRYYASCSINEIEHSNGSKTAFDYDDAGRLVGQVAAKGTPRKMAYAVGYDALGRKRYHEDPAGQRVYYLHDFRNFLVEQWRAPNHVELRRIGLNGNPEAEISAEGTRVTSSHDPMNRPLTRRRSVEICDVASLNAGTLATVTAVATERFEYDKKGRLKSYRKPDGSRTGYEHDGNDRIRAIYPTRLSNRNLVSSPARTEYTYDQAGRIKMLRDGLGVETEFVRDVTGQIKELRTTGSSGAELKTIVERDPSGRITKVIPPHDLSKISCTIGASDREAWSHRFQYTPSGLIATATGPEDSTQKRITTDYTYNVSGLLEGISDGGLRSQQFEYDLLGRVETLVNSASQGERVVYNRQGLIERYTNYHDATITTNYDTKGRPRTGADQRGFRSSWDFDRDDRLSSSGSETGLNVWLGSVTDFDQAGAPERSSIASSTGTQPPRTPNWSRRISAEMCHDINGRLQAIKDGEGQLRRYRYDNRGRVSQVLRTPVGQSGWVTSTLNFANDNKLKEHRARLVGTPGVSSKYERDELGRVSAISHSLTGLSKTFSFDDGGNLCSIVENGATGRQREVTFKYDPRGQEVEMAGDGQSQRSTAYFPDGSIRTIEDSSGSWTYERDDFGRVVRQLQYVAHLDRTFVTSYKYDKFGNVVSIALPSIQEGRSDAPVLDFRYASQTGDITQVGWRGRPLIDQISIDGRHRLAGWNLGGLIQFENTYGTSGLQQTMRASIGGTTLQHLDFEYDNTGQIAGIDDLVDPDFDVDIELDARHRIVRDSSIASGGVTAFRWNTLDQPLARFKNGVPDANFTYSPGGMLDGIVRNGNFFAITHDDFGNRVSDDSRKMAFGFDSNDRLTKYSVSGEAPVELSYAHDGRVVRMGSTHYLYASGELPSVEIVTDRSGNIIDTVYNVHWGGQLVLREDANSGERRYYVSDHHRSPVAEISANGNLLAERTFTSFGKEVARTARVNGQFSTGIGFKGVYRLPKTALSLMHHRVYDPETAAFLSFDPAHDLTLNPAYSFAHANPQTWSDRSGLDPVPSDPSTQPDPQYVDGPVTLVAPSPEPPLPPNLRSMIRGFERSMDVNLGPLIQSQFWIDTYNGLSAIIDQSSIGKMSDAFEHSVDASYFEAIQDYESADASYAAMGSSLYDTGTQVPYDIYGVGKTLVVGTYNLIENVTTTFEAGLVLPLAMAFGEPKEVELLSQEMHGSATRALPDLLGAGLGKRMIRLPKGGAGGVLDLGPAVRSPVSVGTGALSWRPPVRTPRWFEYDAMRRTFGRPPRQTMVEARQTVLSDRWELVGHADAFSADPLVRSTLKSIASDDLVPSGHGAWLRSTDGFTVVPEGTFVKFYSKHGDKLFDSWGKRSGQRVESGHASPLEIFGPGDRIPNYRLFHPNGLSINGNPVRISDFYPKASITLDTILRPDLGDVSWAACRVICD